MNYKSYWQLQNRGDVVLKKRRLFFWTKHERFSDKENVIKQKMVELQNKLIDEAYKLDELRREKEQVIKAIGNTGDRDAGRGKIETRKLSFFNKPRAPEPSGDQWKDVMTWVFSGHRNIASTIAEDFSDMSVTGGEYESTNYEVISTVSHPIRTPSRNQSKKQRGGQQNGQQNGQQ